MGALTEVCCSTEMDQTKNKQKNVPQMKLSQSKTSALVKSRLYESTNQSQVRDIRHSSDEENDLTIEKTFDELMTNNQSTTELKDMKFQDFVIKGQLGEGNFGSVYLVQLKKQIAKGNPNSYAMKRIHKDHLANKKLEENTKLQKYILSNFEHPFITSLKFAFKDTNYIHLVMECALGGSVETLLNLKKHENPRKNPRIKKFIDLGEKGIQFIAASVILAIEHLHKNQIMYRDLKPENVIIFQDGYVKLTDFGLAKVIVSDQQAKTQAGTVIYYAPQMVMKTGYTKLIDMWTLGIFLYELATSQSPFHYQDILGKNKFKTLVQQAEKNRNWGQFVLSQDLKDIINSFLKLVPQQRLGAKGFQQIKQHNFFKFFDWKGLQRKTLISPLLQIIKEYPIKIADVKGLKSSGKIIEAKKQKEDGEYSWNYNYNSTQKQQKV